MNLEKVDLLTLSDFAWNRLQGRVHGLTDEEYLWEPAADSWSIRPDADGVWRPDSSPFPRDPAPITTIAWRLAHITDDILGGERNATWIGLPADPNASWPGTARTAAEALDRMDETYAYWRRCLELAHDLDRPMGEIAGPYAESSRRSFLHHELDELIHHGAEVALLRDLYRATRPVPPIVRAVLDGDRAEVHALLAEDPDLLSRQPMLISQAAAAQRWDGVRLLIDLGVPADPPSGTTALHYAAGVGQLDVVQLLLKHGSKLDVKDPTFDATPAGWAQFFDQAEAAALLEQAES